MVLVWIGWLISVPKAFDSLGTDLEILLYDYKVKKIISMHHILLYIKNVESWYNVNLKVIQ